MPDPLTPEQRSYCMSRIRSTDTVSEKIVRAELHRRGFRFRKNLKTLPGKPDIVFPGAKLAVFIDGDFWHGYEYEKLEARLSEFWKAKIQRNMVRDQAHTEELRKHGWRVLRIWEHEVKRDLHKAISGIETVLAEQKSLLSK